MKNDYQIVIIGAGVIGLSVAYQLQKSGIKSVLILEKEKHYGMGTSSRNSEVIHSGIYYNSNSLKLKYCMRGKEMLYKFCKEKSVWHRQCGKIIVSQKKKSNEILDLYKNGNKNGLKNIRLLDSDDINHLDNKIDGSSGIYIKDTGILDSHQFMTRLYQESYESDHDYLFKTKFISSKKINPGYEVKIRNYSNNLETLTSDFIINCGGLQSDVIGSIYKNSPSISFFKGCYFKLSSKWKNCFKYLVYPLPEKNLNSLGIHLTIDKDGMARLGPNSFKIDKAREDYHVDEALKRKFFNSAKTYIKELSIDDIHPDYSGIRPRMITSNNSAPDFYIKEEKEKGFPGWINLIGIESPGLTSSLAIAEDISKIIQRSKL